MKVNFLPIGSVVLLEGGTKTLMVTGYKMKENAEEEKVYDYVGCVFPEGFMERIYSLFDATQIQDVLFVGCMDGSEEYLKNLQEGVVPVNALSPEADSLTTMQAARRAGKKSPSKPLSSSEMRSRYTKEVISGGQTKKFDVSRLDEIESNLFGGGNNE